MNRTFSITGAVQFGWDKLIKNILPFLVMYGIMMGVSGVISVADMIAGFVCIVPALAVPGIVLRIIINLISFAASMLMAAGMIKVTIKVYNNEKFEIIDCVKEMYLNYKLLPNLILASLVYIAFSLILALLFLVLLSATMLAPYFTTDTASWFGLKTMFAALPGDIGLIVALVGTGLLYLCVNVFIGARIAFYTYFILDKNAGPLDCYKKSFELTTDNFWRIIGFWFVLGGVFLAGLLICCIGVVAAAPIMLLAQVYAYKKLLGEEPANPEEAVPAAPAPVQPPPQMQ